MIRMRITPAVKVLLIACVAMFVLQQTADRFLGGNIIGWLGLVPSEFALNFRFWQVLTYSFLHGDVFHLFFNMLILAFIGGEVEALWGTRRFLRFYFFCVAMAGLVYLLLQFLVWGGLGTPMVGASGGIYGLLMAYGLLFGERTLYFMMLFPMKAKHFVLVLIGLELMSSVFSGRGGLSAAAHLAGMAAGFGYLWVSAMARIRSRRDAGKPKKKKKRQHLKLVINNEQDRLGEDDDLDSPGPRTWH